MRIKQLLTASLLLLFFTKSFGQQYSCDVKQLQVRAYEFVLKNLDSVKKYTPNEAFITSSLEFGEKGELKKAGFYKSYGEKAQKEIKVWKGLQDYIKANFSLCPDSHFYNGREYVLNTAFKLPLAKPDITNAIKEITTGPNYITEGTGQKDIVKNSKYTLDIKNLTVGKRVVAPFKSESVLDYFRSKMIKIDDVFSIAFEVVKVPENKTNYLKYKLYERVNHKGVIITSEGWRPIVNGKLDLSITGKRDMQEGVKDVDFEEKFNLEMDITFQ